MTVTSDRRPLLELFLVLLFVPWLSNTSDGIPIPSFKLQDIVQGSDVVAVLNITTVRRIRETSRFIEHREFKGIDFVAEATCMRILKGNCPSNLSISYFVPNNFSGYRAPGEGTQLVFLRKVGDSYELADPYWPSFPAVSLLTSEGSQGESSKSVDQLVIHELSATIASNTVPARDKVSIVRIEYAIPKDNEEFNTALQQGAKSTVDDAYLANLMRSESLGRNDISELSIVVNGLLQESYTEPSRSAFLYAIGNRLSNPSAVSELARLLRARDANVRAAATSGLSHTGSKSATDALLLALHDSNADVRYHAVCGLADLAGEPQLHPSAYEFEHNSSKYISFWEEWSARR